MTTKFGLNKKRGCSTCPITINGRIHVLSNPAYLTLAATPDGVAERLREFCATPHHHLLGLAVHNHGRLATFDRSIPLKAVHGATASHLAVPTGR